MAKELPLTLAFLHQRPVAAGHALANMRTDEAAIFLDAIPAWSAALVVTAMGAWPASRVVKKMSSASAAAILSDIDYLEAAAILRNLPGAERNKVLADLPAKLRRDLETSLVYPDSTVGAHMTTAFIKLTEQHEVGDAIDLIRRSEIINADLVLIVADDRSLTGSVTALSLFRNPRNTPLVKIMDSAIEPISARSKLSAIADEAGWNDYPALPVVSRQNQVIGMLLRSAITHAESRRNPSRSKPTASVPMSMLDAFIASTIGLAEALLGTETSSTSKGRVGHE